MPISPYFHNLRSAYVAELDDLTFDSEGLDILSQRLSQRRKEIDFLVRMLELSPEMVAVVFHNAFRFQSRAAMEHLLSHEADDLPEWGSLCDTVDVHPWALGLLDTIRKQPQGEWFLSVAAGLEYMLSMPDAAHSHGMDDEDAEPVEDTEEEAEARAREEAGADWMAEQGFDRKD